MSGPSQAGSRVRSSPSRAPGSSPDSGRLHGALTSALTEPSRGESIAILERTANLYGSTYPSEIIRCRIRRAGTSPSSTELTVFAKRGTALLDRRSDHARGVPHEVDVYRHILPLLSVPRPEFLGAAIEPGDGGEGWLFLRHLESAIRLDEATGGSAIRRAAEELAVLHSEGERVASGPGRSFLNGFGRTYLERFTRRWKTAAADLGDGRRWIGTLSRGLGDLVDVLDGATETVVHGEAFVDNVLVGDGRTIFVDWESTGVGPGELDLAALLARWPENEARHAARAYARARWPAGEPASFSDRLHGAQLVTLIRILNRHLPGGRDTKRTHIILEEIRAAARRLGILS